MLYSKAEKVSPITGWAIARYMLLPGIFPMLRNVSHSINRIFFVFIQVLGTAGLIDRNHPCLRSENIGRYSLSEILLSAWQNLKFDRRHMHQVFVYSAVILSCLLLVGLITAFGAYLFTKLGSTAHAQYFGMPKDTGIEYNPSNDWAFQYLERVFGGKAQTGLDFWIPGDIGAGANPWYTALFVGVMKTYSQALLFIAGCMVLYMVFTALVESARSGVPLGERFDSVWAPIRFALALGMMLPVSGAGYNGAQMLAFQSAEWGSNLATNIWHRSIVAMEKTPGGQDNKFMAAIVNDPGYRFVRDMFLINVCVYGYSQILAEGKIDDINGRIDQPIVTLAGKNEVYDFGNSATRDFCGSVIIRNDIDVPADYYTSSGSGGSSRSAGTFFPSQLISNYKNAAMMFMPEPYGYQMADVAKRMVKNAFCQRDTNYMDMECEGGVKCVSKIKGWIYEYWKTALGRDAASSSSDHFMATYNDSINDYNNWVMDSLKKDAQYGWASAGAFYLRLSYALSIMDDALSAQPQVAKLPLNVKSMVATPRDPTITNSLGAKACKIDPSQPQCKRWEGSLALYKLLEKANSFVTDGVQKDSPADYQKLGAHTYDSALEMPNPEETGTPSYSDAFTPGFTFLFDYFKMGNDLNPLGQVIGWGNTFINFAGIMVALGSAMSIASLWVSWLSSVATMAFTIAQVAAPVGFILMFVLPLLPFLYFTFAVVEWVASIAEAVIGLPLWALTFISNEGDLLGKAKKGVMMLFEITLRPVIIVMSLIASILMFSSCIAFFNNAMELYMNVYGQTIDGKSAILSFAPTVAASLGMMIVYMFMVYLLATSCFKLIEVIPNTFMRWFAGGDFGGFGSMIGMGATGKSIAFASVVVAKTAVDVSKSANAVVTEKVALEKAAKDYKKEHDKWRKEEEARIARSNKEAFEYNDTLDEVNAIRRSKGYDELKAREYERPPQERDRQYFYDLARSKMNFEGRKPFWHGGYYSDIASAAHFTGGIPPAGSGPGSPGVDSGSRSGGSLGLGASGGPLPGNAGTRMGYSRSSDTTVAPTYTGRTGKVYPGGAVNKALADLDLPANAKLSDIKKKYRELVKKYGSDEQSKRENKDQLATYRNAWDLLEDALDLRNVSDLDE